MLKTNGNVIIVKVNKPRITYIHWRLGPCWAFYKTFWGMCETATDQYIAKLAQTGNCVNCRKIIQCPVHNRHFLRTHNSTLAYAISKDFTFSWTSLNSLPWRIEILCYSLYLEKNVADGTICCGWGKQKFFTHSQSMSIKKKKTAA